MFSMKLVFVLSLFPVIYGSSFSSYFSTVKKYTYCQAYECCEDVYVKNEVPGKKDTFSVVILY